jgi:uncharacterized protein DUF6536
MGGPKLGEKTITVSTVEYAESSSSASQHHLDRDDEPAYSVFKQPRAWWTQNYLSWRFYVTIYAGLGLLVTFIVLVALLSAIAAHGVDHTGRIKVYEGSCANAKKSSLFAHLFISGLGTYMLSASAYVMVGST